MYNETVNINLLEETLAKFKNKDLQIKIFAKDSTEKIITVPSQLITELLRMTGSGG